MKSNTKLQKLIEKNDDVSEEVKDTIIEIYGDIYAFMDKKNFLRWINFQNVSNIARSIIYSVCQESEDKHLDDRTMGYFKMFRDENNQLKRKIVLKREKSKDKRIGAHETFHSFANGLGGYTSFFGEGITEFLSSTMYDAENKYYSDNVDTIYLLVSMYGMKPIRDYFLNHGDTFFSVINKEIADGSLFSDRGKELTEKTNEMLDVFEQYQKLIAARKNKDDESNVEEEQDCIEKGRELLIGQYIELVKTSIDKLEYYENGVLNFEKFNTDLLKVFRTAEQIGVSSSYLMSKQEEITDYLIDNSHLLVGVDESEKETTRNELFGIISDQFYEGYYGGKIHKISQSRSVFKKLNQNVEEKVASYAFRDENFTEFSKFQYKKYFQVLNNFGEKVCSSREELEKHLEKISVTLSSFPQEFKSFCEKLINTFRDVNALAKKSYMRDENVRIGSTKVVAISDSKSYIIQKDKESSILSVNGQTGELIDIPLSSVKYNSKGICVEELHSYDVGMEKYPAFVSFELGSGNKVYRIMDRKNMKTSYISLSDENSGAVLNGLIESRIDSVMDGFEGLKDSIIQDQLIQELYDRIHNNEYSINSGDRNATINFDKFVKDYVKLRSFLPIDKFRIDLRLLTNELIDHSFGVHFEGKNVEDDNPELSRFIHEYMTCKQSIESSVANLSRLEERNGDPNWHRIRKNASLYIINDLDRIRALMDKNPECVKEAGRLSSAQSQNFILGIVGLSKTKTKTSDFKRFFDEVGEKEEEYIVG